MEIAICDDDELFNEIMSKKLSTVLNKNQIKYNITPFFNGSELISALNDPLNRFDVVFLDVDMPGVNGENVAQYINSSKASNNNYPPKQILNDEQLERWYDFFYTELTTGMRRGEICGLRWEDFNAENGKLKIRRSVTKKKGGGLNIGETKTETGTRTIILPPSTAELLQRRKETALGEWIFPNIYEPEKPMHPDYAYHRLKTLLKQAELPLIRFHDLRHQYVKYTTKKFMDFSEKFFRNAQSFLCDTTKGADEPHLLSKCCHCY